jgi:hypothetical protein
MLLLWDGVARGSNASLLHLNAGDDPCQRNPPCTSAGGYRRALPDHRRTVTRNQNDMNDTLINLADLTARQSLTTAATERGRAAFPG